MKKVIFPIILLFMGFVGNSLINSDGGIILTSLNNSTLTVSTNNAAPRQGVSISVKVANDTTIVEGVDVALQSTDGTFKSNDQSQLNGFSDANGFFNATWIAPDLSFANPSIQVNLTATISDLVDTVVLFELINVTNSDDSTISNSKLITPDIVVSGQTAEIVAQVLGVDGKATPNVQVTFEELGVYGNFTTSNSGLTNSTGYFNATWQAPTLATDQAELAITITALIEAGSDVNITLTKEFFVRPYDATSLTITGLIPTQVVENSVNELSFTVKAGTVAVYNASLTLTIDAGTFNNSDVSIVLLTDTNGIATVNWTAPDVVDNMTVILAAHADLLTLSGDAIFNIDVYPEIRDFNALWDISKTNVKQNVSITVTLTVLDSDTNTSVVGATVDLLLEIGIWDESNDAEFIGITNSNGKVSATFNGTSTYLLFENQVVNVTASLSMDGYNNFETSDSFTIIKLPDRFEFKVEATNLNITEGGTVTLILSAFRNDLPLVDATFRLTATGGQFSNGQTTMSNKTDNQGKLTMTWSSTGLPELKDKLSVFITIELVNSGLDSTTLTVNVSPGTAQSNTSTNNTSTGDNGLNTGTIAAAGAAVALIVVVVVVVSKKK